MSYSPANVSKGLKIAFPIIVTFIAGFIAPASVALVGGIILNLIPQLIK